MRPIKPKRLSKALERDLNWSLKAHLGLNLTLRDVRAILAALEYERQRTESARPLMTEAFLKAAEKVAYSPKHQRAQTAAVVPKPKAKLRG